MSVIQKKVCLLGDFSVGKTSLVRRYVEGRFSDKYLSTIGAKITRKTIQRPEHKLSLIIWDLAGGDDFVARDSTYLLGAAGALIVCDLTRHETLPALQHYTEQLRRFNADAAIVYVANKVDLVDERVIDDEALREQMATLDGELFVTSAKTGVNVEEAFLLLADLLEQKP